MLKVSAFALLLSTSLLQPQRAVSQAAPALLNPALQPKFVNPLPVPALLDVRGGGTHTLTVTQFQQQLGLVDPVTLQPLNTTVWGYNGTYPGPTILAQSGVPANFVFLNKLPITAQGHLLQVDPSIDWAFSGDPAWQSKGVPIVTHLHGGQTESASDGLPLQWYTPDFAIRGPGFVKGTSGNPYYYSNNQEAATIWYHDHALGITRLNVYAGLAGYYVVTDEREAALQAASSIPGGAYDIGLAIQDRMFTADGQLYYPSAAPIAGAPEPSIQPEFFGDHILVNGMAWPVLDVEPRQYRFRMLNGSDSRFYDLYLSNDQPFFQIASDVGLLEAPFNTQRVLIGPGERKDVVIDFSAFTGQTIILKNNARTPFPRGGTVNPATTGQIMAFRVTKPLSAVPLTTLPASLRPTINRLPAPVRTRQLILFEGLDQYGRLMTLLGTPQQGGLHFFDPVTERPVLNTVEVWEIHNTTVDAHPIHVHMVKMQLLNRQKFSANVNITTGQITGPIQYKGAPRPPLLDERGWKDTYVMLPGEVTRVTARFEIPGPSVWHCHILSHEDHEMMRPYEIVGAAAASTEKTPELAMAETESQLQFKVWPNPFSSSLLMEINLARDANVAMNVYDIRGSKVKEVYKGRRQAGPHQFTLDGNQWADGTYFCEILVDNQRIVRKLVLHK